MLTVSRLSRWSINYYNDTARQARQAGLDRRQANGGLGEYYSAGDRGRIAAERLADKAGGIFDGDYLREHISWAMPAPCTPPKASPSATPPPQGSAGPSSAIAPAAPWPTSA